MDEDRARELLRTQRAALTSSLTDTVEAQQQDQAGEQAPGDAADPAQSLTAEGVDDALAAGLRDRLAAIDRAEQRLDAGTFGTSTRSGLPIPEERLEADPAAELTVEEAETPL